MNTKIKRTKPIGFSDQMFAGLAYRKVYEDGMFFEFSLYPVLSLNFIGAIVIDASRGLDSDLSAREGQHTLRTAAEARKNL